MMCGIAGLVQLHTAAGVPLRHIANAMAERLAHRGPDGTGVWIDGAVALSHTRLAIRDLAPTGDQPMISADGRWVLVYNGEVYSQQELTQTLARAGKTLRGSSDTEAMLEHVAAFGLDRTLPQLIGMFAFALWDRHLHELHLVRDRMGIKPLYWTQQPSLLAFASELKAFTAIPGWTPTLDRDAVAAYLRLNYFPAPHTAYVGVNKLRPGHKLTIKADGSHEETAFWNLRSVATAGIGTRLAATPPSVDDVDALVSDAVKRRLVSDVPIGVLLSGGIDSSLVTAMMVETSSSRVRSFSIGFQEDAFNEAHYARAMANHLGTDHTELYVEPSRALDVISDLPRIYDEPFGDSSQIPSVLLSSLTRQHVTVALTGDGGDELFSGYERYRIALDLERKLGSVPRRAQEAVARLMAGISDWPINAAMRALPARYQRKHVGPKMREVAQGIRAGDPNALYRSLLTHWPNPTSLAYGATESKSVLWDATLGTSFPSMLDRMQLLDMLTYLPDDILVKMDRASMSVGLEARVPLLDHRLVEMSWLLPQNMKVRDGQSKWILRQLLGRRMPRSLFERPKMGFGVPIESWLRGPLRPWADDLLSEERLRRQGLLDPVPIRTKWHQHLAGANTAHHIWGVLMLQGWIDEWSPSLG